VELLSRYYIEIMEVIMASFIWNRDIEEAYQNPYEYEAQEQFSREATRILMSIKDELIKDKFIYRRSDTSLEKALYMLHMDSIESLIECLDLLKEKRHSVAARLLRDVFENASLCNYFYEDQSDECKKSLKRWFKDEVISNSVCRSSIEKRYGKDAKKERAKNYKYLSKITHRTYRILSFSYSLASEERLIYEGRADSRLLVLPHTISMYFALLANMIEFELSEIINNKVVELEFIESVKQASYEEDIVERRFNNILTNGYIDNRGDFGNNFA
jgi:actin-related protein